MESLVLSGLETAINQYLKLDPDTISRLATLQGKKIKVEITDWNIHFTVLPMSNGLQLIADQQQKADTTIKGKLLGLSKVGLSGANSQSLFDNKIEISGDTQLGEEIRSILQQCDIDWEEHLSHFVGDGLSFHLMQGFRGIRNFLSQSAAIIIDKTKEYLHEETHAFPTKEEISTFIHNVTTLRNDVDRAKARIKNLHSPKKT